MAHGNGHRVSVKNLDRTRTEAEASELRFPPGSWPQRLSLVCERGYWMEDFDLHDLERDPDGDMCAVVYRSSSTGRQITVFND